MCKFGTRWPSSLMRKFIVTSLAIIYYLLKHTIFLIAREGGLEPTTLGFGDRCSTN